MTSIEYINGDATSPSGQGNKIIVHVCNDIGGWGKGFVLAISKKWKEPEEQYRNWFRSNQNFQLGAVQFVKVEEDLWVANLVGQHKIRRAQDGSPPIRYEAVREGMVRIKDKAIELNASVHMPRIGCGLAGGKWEEIEPILVDNLSSFGIKTTVYDFV